MPIHPVQATAVAALALVLAGCSTRSPAPRDEVRSASSGQPFATRAIARFDTPWAMSALPASATRLSRTALVSEKDGRLWLVDLASGKRQPVAGVPAAHVAGQGGLGDVVAHPAYARTKRIYLSLVEKGDGDTSGAALGYGTLSLGKAGPRIANFRIIWRQSPKVPGNGHFSHRIAFAPDGSLFLSSGEREKFDPAQSLTANLGKVLHLDAEGKPTPGGPFAKTGAVAAQFHSIGHRNILGLAFAPDGRLWATEMGPKGGDELNLIEAGRNYGWPIVSNGSHYDGRDIPDHSTAPQYAAPALSWNPGISPAGMIVYSGKLFPGWEGDAIFGALSGEALVHADLDEDTAVKAAQWPMNARIREVEQGPDGEVYLLEDGRDGKGGSLLRLDPVRR